MIKKFTRAAAVAVTLLGASYAVEAATTLVTEAPTFIRLEQYTGAGAPMAMWRLPTPGVSNFPGSTCKALVMPTSVEVHASRFMALYLFAKVNSKNIFIQYDTTSCVLVSFGIDG